VVIRSNDRRDSITLEIADQAHTHVPSFALVIDVGGGDFKGVNPEVWFDYLKFEGFCWALRDLVRNRAGRARLSSMSPDEFDMLIEPIDSAGHMVLQCALSRQKFIGRGCRPQSVSLSFALDSEFLNQLFDDFEELRLQVRPPNMRNA
jgi:hypothetical protein